MARNPGGSLMSSKPDCYCEFCSRKNGCTDRPCGGCLVCAHVPCMYGLSTQEIEAQGDDR